MAEARRLAFKSSMDENGGEESEAGWLITYSDAVTLLMTFMVLLLAVSTVDQAKYDQVVESIKKESVGGQQQYISPFETLEENLTEVVQKTKQQENMTIIREPKGISVELSSTSFYKIGSAEIQPESYPALNGVIQSIKEFNYDNYEIEVEGHTDNVPINTKEFPSNWELSVHRATNILRYLENNGLEQKGMKAAGYADTRPKVPNMDQDGNSIPENQAKNRRIIINIFRVDKVAQ